MLVVITPHFVKPLTPDEKAKMPDWADTFLPTVKQEQEKKHKGKKDGGAQASPDQAEFTGPSGYQTPSK